MTETHLVCQAEPVTSAQNRGVVDVLMPAGTASMGEPGDPSPDGASSVELLRLAPDGPRAGEAGPGRPAFTGLVGGE